jgi:predicted MFS family arabinose efflux permease
MTTPRLPKPALILAGAAVLMSIGMGMRQSLGLFLSPVVHDLGVTAADFTFAVAMQNIVWGLVQTPVGMIADKWGIRPAMLVGVAIYILGLIVMAEAGGAASLAVSGGLIGVALACTASSLAMTACARAVTPAARSSALGVVAACGSLGTLLIAPSVQFLLARWDWRAGLVFFVLLAIAMLPAAFLAGGADRIPRPPDERVSMADVIGRAMRHRGFVVMSVAYFVCGLQLIFLTTHLPNYLAICGQDPMLGASALATIGGVNIFGSWFAGWLGGRFPKHLLLGSMYIARSCVLTIYFMTPPTPTTTIVFAAAMGMLWLGVIPLVSGLVADMFGTRYMATLLGVSFVMHQVGSFLGAWGGGLIFDMFGSYDRAWEFGVLIGAAAGMAQILFGGPVRPKSGSRPVLAAA